MKKSRYSPEQVAYRANERRACEVLILPKASRWHRSVADEQAAVRIRPKYLAQVRVSHRYWRLHILLQREGWTVDHKASNRLYWKVGLMLRNKIPKRVKTNETVAQPGRTSASPRRARIKTKPSTHHSTVPYQPPPGEKIALGSPTAVGGAQSSAAPHPRRRSR